jgi:hypothetical protein
MSSASIAVYFEAGNPVPQFLRGAVVTGTLSHPEKADGPLFSAIAVCDNPMASRGLRIEIERRSIHDNR